MKIIQNPSLIKAAGIPEKRIEEFIGNVNTGTGEVSVARMKSPQGWTEPGQTPEFNEYTIVLSGILVAETKNGKHEIRANQAFIAEKGEWIRYSSPYENGAEYIAVCVPAFSPASVHRDE